MPDEPKDAVEKKAWNIALAVRKLLKGTGGGLLIFALLRAGHGGGWADVAEARNYLEVLISAAYGLFEAIWGTVKWYNERRCAK